MTIHIENQQNDYTLPNKSLTLMHAAVLLDSLESFIFLQTKGIPIDISSQSSYLPIHYGRYK